MINRPRRAFLGGALLSLAASPFVTLAGCASRLSSEFVIVGSGPAGISLAEQLAQRGRQVLVLEGGTRQMSPEMQARQRVVPGRWGLRYGGGGTVEGQTSELQYQATRA